MAKALDPRPARRDEWTIRARGGIIETMRTASPGMEHAVHLMKADLSKKWTVTLLGKMMAMSRPVFARRFLAAFGEAPLHYLTRLRMEAAAADLSHTDDRLVEIARRVGYETEFALSRAFRRQFGVPPGLYRRQIRTGEAAGRTTCLAA